MFPLSTLNKCFLVHNLKVLRVSTIYLSMEAHTKENFINEGQVEIRGTSKNVFYNCVQEFNRDLSIAVLNTFADDFKAEKIAKFEQKPNNQTQHLSENENVKNGDYPEHDMTILDALSATGLRAIRYAKEVRNVTKIVANDLSARAVDTIKANVIHNQVENIIETSHSDARFLMYKHIHPAKRFSAIDLDPYGCPSIFLDAAVQSVQDGGLLLVTATDMAILAGNSPESCYAKYGAISLKTKCCHEMALRILLQCIEAHANRYKRYIEPVLSISADFYIRVFVKVYSGATHCKKTLSKLSFVYQCVGCDTITLQPLGKIRPNPSENNPHQTKESLPIGLPVGKKCIHCNEGCRLGGPIWSAPIHDVQFVSRILANVEFNSSLFGTARRLQGLLTMITEELQNTPLYYTVNTLFGRVHLECMPMLIMRSAILNAGYDVSYSHASKVSLKTNAPAQLIWDILRTWAQTHPPKPAKLEADSIAKYILNQEIQNTIDMSPHENANPRSRQCRQRRFQVNPAPYWGPGTRAVINIGENKMTKAKYNQNKNKNKKRSAKRPHSSQSDEESSKKLEPDVLNV